MSDHLQATDIMWVTQYNAMAWWNPTSNLDSQQTMLEKACKMVRTKSILIFASKEHEMLFKGVIDHPLSSQCVYWSIKYDNFEMSHLEKYHGRRMFIASYLRIVLSGVYLMWHFCSNAHISPTLHLFDRWLNFSGHGFFRPQIWFIWFILKWFLSLQVSTSISESLQHKKTWVPKLFWNISHPTQLTCKI